jgi:hypothetical protein
VEVFREHVSGFSADGTHHIGMTSIACIFQSLPATFEANAVYTLRVAVGNRAGQTASGNASIYELGVGGLGTAGIETGNVDASVIAPEGAFVEAPPVVFNTQSLPAAVGRDIYVQLCGRGDGRSHFDNIRLDITSVLVTNANNSGPGSLRQAIIDANDGDTILFHDGVFNGEPEDVITLASQISFPSKRLTIDASALCAGVTLSGGATTRILNVGAASNVTLRGLHLVDGLAVLGAGVLNDGTLTLRGCTISGCVVDNSGAGIANYATVTLINSTIHGNHTADFGGGINNNGPPATINLINSTVTGNSSDVDMAGIGNNSGTLNIENSIVAGNTAPVGEFDIGQRGTLNRSGANVSTARVRMSSTIS